MWIRCFCNKTQIYDEVIYIPYSNSYVPGCQNCMHMKNAHNMPYTYCIHCNTVSKYTPCCSYLYTVARFVRWKIHMHTSFGGWFIFNLLGPVRCRSNLYIFKITLGPTRCMHKLNLYPAFQKEGCYCYKNPSARIFLRVKQKLTACHHSYFYPCICIISYLK